MLESLALYSRLWFLLALGCVAVVPFTMSADAARASPKASQGDSGVRHVTRRRLYSPHSPTRPPYTGQPSLQTGANFERKKGGNYRVVPSLIYYQSNPDRLKGGSLGYSNVPDNRPTSVQSGMNRASSNPTPSYNSHTVNTRKSAFNKTPSPSHQRPSPSEVWDAREARKSFIKDKVPGNDSPRFSSQTGRYWSPSLPTSRGLHSGYKETNELTSAGVQMTSGGIQSSKSLAPARKTAPGPTSIRRNSDASLIKSSPSQERLTASVADFSQGSPSVSRSETPRRQNIQPYLSQTAFGGHKTVPAGRYHRPAGHPSAPQKHRASEVLGRFSSGVEPLQQSQRKPQTKDQLHLFDNANPLHHNDNYYQTQISAPGRDDIAGRLDPLPHVIHAAADITSAVSSFSKATPRGSMQATKPGQSIKSLHGSRGFEHSQLRTAKELLILSSSEGTNSREHRSDERMGNPVPNMNPLSQMYREVSAALVKPQRTPTDYTSPSPGMQQDVTSGFKEAWPRLPKRDAGVESEPDHGQFRTYGRIYGPKAYGTRSLETVRTSGSESAAVQQDFAGYEPRSSEISRPKSSRVNTAVHAAPSREDHKPLLKTKTPESVSRYTSDDYDTMRKISNLLRFRPDRNGIGDADNTALKQNQERSKIDSAHLGRAAAPNTETQPKSVPRKQDLAEIFPQKVSLLNGSAIRRISDMSLIKRIPSPERPTASVTEFSKGSPSESLNETPRRQNIQSYLSKDSQAAFGGHETVPAVPYHGPAALPSAPHKHRASEVVGRFSSDVKPLQQSQSKPPTKDQLSLSDPLHLDDNYQAPKGGYAEYQNTAQISAPGRHAITQRLVPLPHVTHVAANITSAVSSFSKATPRRSMLVTNPGQSIKSLHDSRRFEPSELRTAGVESEPDHGQFRTYGRIYGPKAFSTRSLGTARTSGRESAGLQQGYNGYKPRGSQISRPKSRHVNTAGHAAPSREDRKPLLKTETPASVSRSDEYDTIRKISRVLGSLPYQNKIEDADNTAHKQNRESPKITSALIRRPGEPDADTRPKSEPRKQDLTELLAKKAILFSGSTSSTVRGKRVKAKKLHETAHTEDAGKEAVVWPPKRPAPLLAIVPANILGSASLSLDKARTRMLTASPDEDDFLNTSAVPKQEQAAAAEEEEEGAGFWALESEDGVTSGGNSSGGPKEVEESQPAVRSKGAENAERTSAFFLDDEGSGSGGFNGSDDSSADDIESRGLDEDSAELEYLRISTGNMYFKSMELPHTDT